MKSISKILAGSVLLFGMTSTAFAGPITYNFRNNTDCGNFNSVSETCTDSGLTMTVTSTGGKMNNNRRGIGINKGPARDSIGGGETIKFDFSPTSVVVLSSLVFEKTGSGRDSGAGSFDLFLGGIFAETISWAGGGANSRVLETFAAGPAVTMFDFRNVTGAFRVSKLTVSVPEPSVLTLLGLGLLGLGLTRRKKTA